MRAVRSCQQGLVLSLAFLAIFAVGSQASAQDRAAIEIVPNIPHSALVRSVAFSPEGARVISGSFDRTLKLWDAASGQLIRTFEGHSNVVSSVAFSPDGARVISGSEDYTLKLWDAATGQLLRTFEGHSRMVNAVAFSPDGSRALSGGEDRILRLWDAATGRLLRTFEGHSGYVHAVAFSPNGTRVLSGGFKTMRLWDVATGQLLRTFEGYSNAVKSVAFSPDGAQLLSGSFKTLKLWNATTGELVLTLEGHPRWIASVAFSPDGGRLASGGEDKTVKLWDAVTGRLLRTFEGHPGKITSVAFSPDGSRVLSGGEDATLKLWDAATGQLLHSFAGHSFGVMSVVPSPDGSRVLAGGRDKTLKLWDAATGQLLRTFEGHSLLVWSVAFSPDGERLLSGSEDKTLKLWDAATGQLLRTFGGHSYGVHAVAFSPDGTRVLSGSEDATLKLWDAATGQLIRTFDERANRAQIHSVAFSPDGKSALSGSYDKDAPKLWDTATGQLIRTFEGHSGWALAASFSPDGTRVLSGSSDNTLKLWDAASGQLLRTFEGHSGTVWAVAFSPDGTRVLSGSADGTLKLWDAATGQLVRTFRGHSNVIHSVAFSPDGTRVLSGSSETTIRLWDVATGTQLGMLIGGRDGEWLAMTPAGFFAASPKGTKMLGIVRGLEATTIDQVHQSLFNPDLVREVLAGDPGGEAQEAAKAVNLEKVLDSGPAPTIAVISHPEGSQSTTDLVTVAARIKDNGKGVGRIEWRVNGITTAVGVKPPSARPAYTIAQRLALDPGDNIVEVIAYNGSNLLASLPARTTIKFTGPADRTKPKLHILAIGVNAYVDRGSPLRFPPLGLAVKDATAFGASMKEAAAGLYDEVRVTLALDKQATRDSLEKTIAKIARAIHPRDSFILFAAGHGTSDNGRFYFIPQDYQSGPGNLSRHAIGQDRLQDWLANRIKAKRAIVLLDTCESGALVAGHVRSRADAPASEAAVGRLHEATGRPVLTAAAAGQFAHEGLIAVSRERHGVFTWALLDALRKGDTNGNGLIELSELVRHVQSVVPKIAAQFGGAGRAATSEPIFGKQAARFGSRGEDFRLVKRLP